MPECSEIRGWVAKRWRTRKYGQMAGLIWKAARLPEQPADKNTSPTALPLGGELKAGKPGKP